MGQVDRLLRDKQVHVAAPIVLAGAALEEFLRALVTANDLVLARKPSLPTYADALRKADVITRQDNKDITTWADQRNDAAHGNFDSLTFDRARLMVDGIELFMRRHAIPKQ
jgi:hypothetical protein